jgi:RimJ/RimL family protein N-acetyltransferase
MKLESNPIRIQTHEILKNNTKIGYINLVWYTYGRHSIPHLEYFLEEEYRNQGIMFRALKKYFKSIKKNNLINEKIIAVVNKNNLKSINILKYLKFIFIEEVDGCFVFIYSSKYTKQHLKNIIKKFNTRLAG